MANKEHGADTVQGVSGESSGKQMTHREIVERAVKWLRNTQHCLVVLAERAAATGETPDAIGWKGVGSILVECKSSRRDFWRDRAKISRDYGGMGWSRWYMTPPGLIGTSELPPEWGLLEAEPKIVRVARKAAWRQPDLFGMRNEIRVLASELRLYHLAAAGIPLKDTQRGRQVLSVIERMKA